MPRTRSPYSLEFRQQILELVRTGRTPNELAREFEPSGETIRQWVKQAELDAGQRQDGLTTDQKSEIAKLRVCENMGWKRMTGPKQGKMGNPSQTTHNSHISRVSNP